MTPKLGRRADEKPKKEGQVGFRPAWPPSTFSHRSWLIQACCVRCGAKESGLRNISPETRIDAEQTEEYVASACDICWALIESYAERNRSTIEEAFWSAPRSETPKEKLGRLPDGLPWSIDQARRMEAWRATRSKDQSLRPWPNRTVLVYLEPPLHQEHTCSRSQRPPTPPTSNDSSFPPF